MTIVLHLFFGLNASSLGLWLFKVLIGWVFLVSCHVTAASCLWKMLACLCWAVFHRLQFQVNLQAFYYMPWEEFSVFGVALLIHSGKDISKLLQKVNWAKLCSCCRFCLLTFSWTPHLRELINLISEWVTVLHTRFSKIPCSPIKTLLLHKNLHLRA